MESFIAQARAVSDPTRLRMLKLLEGGEMCVCDIMEVMGLGQSTASKHLGVLRAAGLVETRKAGTWSHYRLAEKARGSARDFLEFIESRLDDSAAVKKDRRTRQRRRQSACGKERPACE